MTPSILHINGNDDTRSVTKNHVNAKLNGFTHEVTTQETIKPYTYEAAISGSTKLQRLLKETDELIVCPGVYDGFSARIALSVGFSALYMVWFSIVFIVHR